MNFLKIKDPIISFHPDDPNTSKLNLVYKRMPCKSKTNKFINY